MKELDKNVFIKKWFLHIDKYVNSYKEYLIYYIDGSKRQAVFAKESTEEKIKPQLLHLIDKDLKEKGWIEEELEPKTISQLEKEHIDWVEKEYNKYNPAEDPYYKQEWLYVDEKIGRF